MTLHSLVLLDKGSINWNTLDISTFTSAFPDCVMYDHTRDEDVPQRIKDATIVLTNKGLINAEAIKAASKLKLVSVLATGYNCVDLDAARAANVTVCNVRSYSTASVVQHVFMFITTLMTNAHHYIGDVNAGKWQTSEQFCFLNYPIHELAGKTLGIIGYGELGHKIEQVARAFDMKILLAERKGAPSIRSGRTAFDHVLSESDVITIHCPLTDDTRNMINATELRSMKKTAIVINTARGGIVNEAALRDALRTRVIAGAAVDVLTKEPPTNGNPLLDNDIPNLLVTPHTAWASIEAQQRLLNQTIENIRAFIAGNPVNVVV